MRVLWRGAATPRSGDGLGEPRVSLNGGFNGKEMVVYDDSSVDFDDFMEGSFGIIVIVCYSVITCNY